jgi:hypothetical protein
MAVGSSEKPVHANQTARLHIIISFINYSFEEATDVRVYVENNL